LWDRGIFEEREYYSPIKISLKIAKTLDMSGLLSMEDMNSQ
jgi:hypothetical protein